MRRFWGLVAEGVCGVFMPWVHGRWVLGLGAWSMRQLSWFGGPVAGLTTVVAAGGGRK